MKFMALVYGPMAACMLLHTYKTVICITPCAPPPLLLFPLRLGAWSNHNSRL